MVRVNRDDLLRAAEAFREQTDAFATALAFVQSGCLHVNETLLAIEEDRLDAKAAAAKLDEAKRMLEHARAVLEDEDNVKGRMIAYVDRYFEAASDLREVLSKRG
jgi:hypothetical protein